MIRITIEVFETTGGVKGERSSHDRATWQQFREIFNLAEVHSLTPDAVRLFARMKLGHGLSTATTLEATQLIYELLASKPIGTKTVPA